MIDSDRQMELTALAEALGERLVNDGLVLATAESCTGGWAAQVVTSIAGSSAWFERGFVTYTNQAKQEMLGVSARTLNQFGAVSEETVCEMALGALQYSHARIAVAISGVAGPGGGSAQKPVGTVCFGWAMPGKQTISRQQHFDGDREMIRYQAVRFALQGVLDMCKFEDLPA